MYVAVKGGEAAIANAHRLLADRRRGDRAVPALTLEQIAGQLALAVDRVMAEGSLYDPELAAMAVRQSRGDLIEAIFLIRAYRTTLPRFAASRPIDTGKMLIERRISATYKDLPGGQLLGPTFDYTHRLIEPDMAEDGAVAGPASRQPADDGPAPRVTDILGDDPLAAGLSGLARSSAPGARQGRRGLPARPRLFDPARLRPHPPLRRRDPHRRSRGRGRPAGIRLCRHHRPRPRDRMPDGLAVHRLEGRAAEVHSRIRIGIRTTRTQGDGHEPRRPGAARR